MMPEWLKRIFVRLHRRVRPSMSVPPPRDMEGLEQARRQISRAETTLADLAATEPVVDHVARTAAEIHRRNNLGPAFMQALGKQRKA